MSVDTNELIEVFERLPADKRVEVADFARFLLSRHDAGGNGAALGTAADVAGDGDAAWERIIADPRQRPRLEAYSRESLAEGSEPLDLDQMRRLAGMGTADQP